MTPVVDEKPSQSGPNRRAIVRGGVGVLGTSLFAGLTPAQAQTQDNASPLTPRFPLHGPGGDTFDKLMAYTPADDPDAAYFRCRTPLAPVIAPFAPTQAHPRLDPRPRAGTLVAPYLPLDARASPDFSRQRAGRSPTGRVFVPRTSAIYALVVGWGGTGMIPNPAMVDLAHRNGAPALGVVFQPDRRLYDSSTVPASAVAAKLVSLARYFGFDGYFVNFEGGDARGHAQILQLIVRMKRLAAQDGRGSFYIQFYDGQTGLAGMEDLKSPAADSVMLDQGWSGYGAVPGCCSGAPVAPSAVAETCGMRGLDRFSTAYFGLQLYPGPGYLSVAAPQVIAPNGEGPAYGSLQVYSADDGLRKMLMLADMQSPPDAGVAPDVRGRRKRDLAYTLERKLVSGGAENPALDNRPTSDEARAYAPIRAGKYVYTHFDGRTLKPHDQIALPISYGVANFIAERSVIGATPFVTRFNTGEGDGFWVGGENVGRTPWFDMGAQDLLPTWQWRREPLTGEFDPTAPQPTLLDADFDLTTAYEGGASLRVSGGLEARTATRLWLYKTDLTLSRNDTLHLVHRSAGEGMQASIGLVFQDAPDQPRWLAFLGQDAARGEALAGGWTHTRLPLAHVAGKTVAAILLGVAPVDPARGSAEVSLNFGELYLGPAPDPVAAPAAPSSLTVLALAPAADGRSAALRLGWDYAPGAAYYDVFHRAGAGARTWLGRINGDRLHVADVPRMGGDRIEVVAVAADRPLTPSAPATIQMG